MSLIDDVCAARKAHMTYGQYMSQPNRQRSKPKDTKTGNGLTCMICGAPLYGQQRKYCGICKVKYGVKI